MDKERIEKLILRKAYSNRIALSIYTRSWIITVGLFISFLSSCDNKLQSTNYAHLYSGTSSILQPDYIIYHHKEDSSKIYFQLNSSELLYVRKDKSEPYHAAVLIHYRLYSGIDSKVIVDSTSRKIEDVTEQKLAKAILGNFSIKAPIGSRYFLKILTTDLNRGSVDEVHLQVDKRKPSGSQFFLVRKAENGIPIFTNYVVGNFELEIESAMNENAEINGRYYNRKFPLAAPPFSTTNPRPFKYRPDSLAHFSLDVNGKMIISTPDSGFVQFQLDTSSRNGYTLFRQNENFPLIKTTEGMVFPLRYICTKSEYKGLVDADNLKKKLDKFWISKTGSKERARELIKKYYNRVQTANQHFTSYIEGWKTDRGMISLIFGPPKVVNKSKDSEIWIYGEETNALSLRFTFNKVNNPFTNNDYKLNRGAGYRTNWYRAVDAWRSGRVYWVN